MTLLVFSQNEKQAPTATWKALQLNVVNNQLLNHKSSSLTFKVQKEVTSSKVSPPKAFLHEQINHHCDS